jgi:hypothetical protein
MTKITRSQIRRGQGRTKHDAQTVAEWLGSELEASFVAALCLHGNDIPLPTREHRFTLQRRWRFDFAWPTQRVAVEIDGGQWMAKGGRHARDSDREKMNEASLLGWCVLRFSGEMLLNDPVGCIGTVRRALHRQSGGDMPNEK